MFGYTLDLQPDFTIIKSDSLNPFIWIGRGYPYRWITFMNADKIDYLSIDSAWSALELLFIENMPSV